MEETHGLHSRCQRLVQVRQRRSVAHHLHRHDRKGGSTSGDIGDRQGERRTYELRGVKEIRVHIATCKARKAVRTWEHLESALLAMFRQMHWELPKYNKRKGSFANTDDIELFSEKALKKMILEFADA